MVSPSPKVRGLVLLRDGSQCVTCGTRTSPLEMQHRIRVGMGGTTHRPAPDDLATACSTDNARFESDLQTEALVYGWKVRAWVKHAGRIPMFNRPRNQWAALLPDGGLVLLTPEDAVARMQNVYGPEWDVWATTVGLLESMMKEW